MPRLLIYGQGGVGREVLASARASILGTGIEQILFVDDRSALAEIDGVPIVKFEEVQAGDFYIVAVADGRVREEVDEKCIRSGLRPWKMLAPNVIIGAQVEIDLGATINWGTTIAGFSKIGKQFQCHGYGYIGHDCIIEDYVTFGIHVICNGNTKIEDYVYVGTGAIIRGNVAGQQLIIGKSAVIEPGAIVVRSVGSGEIVRARY